MCVCIFIFIYDHFTFLRFEHSVCHESFLRNNFDSLSGSFGTSLLITLIMELHIELHSVLSRFWKPHNIHLTIEIYPSKLGKKVFFVLSGTPNNYNISKVD